MIFITIGTQEPFDRLIKAMDEVAPKLGNPEIIAQISGSSYLVKNMKTMDFIAPSEFNDLVKRAKIIVSHAGMGTIISALQLRKPILVMPRLLKFGEHRNEHQLATARKFDRLNYINVAYDEQELQEKILEMYFGESKSLHELGDFASPELIESLQEFINE
ncbi:UDP-N-acetylglucosamine transferase subunit ALG13 [Arcticibacter pallidicorallinus]|uniref:UDP-N-acetylglucosamine transferase subunit ALG13 n=1 Tax=Arcticibacter pallidicorallinus TaxID=1259464 RepID=A0A2T0UBH7_9SPHI|nr:glycosyltransferase [Arcticibacter pallidicorallinus]PRY55295.1 UDP-N-acetylglucosamine transferase subunit ALG13 [Arcticibacter pallidicorallinus]